MGEELRSRGAAAAMQVAESVPAAFVCIIKIVIFVCKRRR